LYPKQIYTALLTIFPFGGASKHFIGYTRYPMEGDIVIPYKTSISA